MISRACMVSLEQAMGRDHGLEVDVVAVVAYVSHLEIGINYGPGGSREFWLKDVEPIQLAVRFNPELWDTIRKAVCDRGLDVRLPGSTSYVWLPVPGVYTSKQCKNTSPSATCAARRRRPSACAGRPNTDMNSPRNSGEMVSSVHQSKSPDKTNVSKCDTFHQNVTDSALGEPDTVNILKHEEVADMGSSSKHPNKRTHVDVAPICLGDVAFASESIDKVVGTEIHVDSLSEMESLADDQNVSADVKCLSTIDDESVEREISLHEAPKRKKTDHKVDSTNDTDATTTFAMKQTWPSFDQ
ncbi:hypothetical protein U9M48_023365 [Paspalum notatum var. saurae]|uniref:Uncharacterized protein n=1 Tax=Paspalum notatum var. saurae TaxID=547442 RepID=A0AAQ3WVR1_PASNO